MTAPQPPRTDGTYVVDNQVDLLESGFLGTDVRFEISSRAEGPQASLALGIGNNWREGPNVPYFLVATGITWVAGRRVRVGAELEYQHLRVSADQVQLTYEDGRLIETVPLGRVHDWSYAWSVGVYLGLGF